jgi:hypothetical protein
MGIFLLDQTKGHFFCTKNVHHTEKQPVAGCNPEVSTKASSIVVVSTVPMNAYQLFGGGAAMG